MHPTPGIQKMKFPLRTFQFPADLVTFTEEIFNGKLFLCSATPGKQTQRKRLSTLS